jgi:hypothetical protein
MSCRWDREAEEYLIDGEPCRRDEYGDPTVHCTARRTCSQHVGWGELTCARCLGRTRANIKHIGQYAALLDAAAFEAGRVDVEISMLAGPTCDPEAWSWRKATARMGRAWHVSLDEDDDETDPERVLTTWAQMLSEDYRLPRPDRWNVSNAAAFLERILSRVAQDEGQDFPQMARELRKCRNHLDAELSVRWYIERGVPCPTCVETGKVDPAKVRLKREYPHWCDDEDCEQIHYDTDAKDRWVCPRDKDHWWTHQAYVNYVEERKAVGA